MSWSWSYVVEILPELLGGLAKTVGLTLVVSVISLAVGLVIGVFAHTRVPVVSGFARNYISVIRNTPLLVQIYLIFFALPEFGILLSPTVSGVLGVSVFLSAYMGEVYRSGFADVPQSQWEASTAINLTVRETWMLVIIPQALPRVTPMLGNYVNLAFKLTAYMAVIGVVELFGVALRQAEVSYRYLEPITVVGVLYLVVSVMGTSLISLLERRQRRRGMQRVGT